MQLNGLWAPCRILGVYAADLISVALVAASGKVTRDDLTIQLEAVQCHMIEREVDPPLNVLRLYAPNAVDGRTNQKEPGPCPEGCDFVRKLLRRYKRHFIHVPIGGTGWLDMLSTGARVPGSLYLYVGPVLNPTVTECVSVSDEILRHGHGVPRGKRVA